MKRKEANLPRSRYSTATTIRLFLRQWGVRQWQPSTGAWSPTCNIICTLHQFRIITWQRPRKIISLRMLFPTSPEAAKITKTQTEGEPSSHTGVYRMGGITTRVQTRGITSWKHFCRTPKGQVEQGLFKTTTIIWTYKSQERRKR
jgi:hypothetical protein